MIRTSIVTVMFVGFAALAFAQQKPDFSGEWILNRQASTLSAAASPIQTGVVRIEHRDPTFHYKASLASESGKVEYDFDVPTDGHDVVGNLQQGMTVTTSLRWEAEALLLTSRIHRKDGELNISFRYELLDAGRRLRAVEQLRGGGRDQDNIWIFDRR